MCAWSVEKGYLQPRAPDTWGMFPGPRGESCLEVELGKVTRKEGARARLLPTVWLSTSLSWGFNFLCFQSPTTNYGLNILTLGGLDQEAENHHVDFRKKTAKLEIPHLRAHSRPRPFLECLGQRWLDGTEEVDMVIGRRVGGGGGVRV